MKMSGGEAEDGVVVGNTYDKYGSRNPIVRRIMHGFDSALNDLVARTAVQSVHEVGCGEGYWVIEWNQKGLNALGSDFSNKVIAMARQNAADKGLPGNLFKVGSIYDVVPERDQAELIVCCEVLEHLENPAQGLEALRRITGKYAILSVPREPLWCALNLARGKYISALGNTPGHIQHWSKRGFVDLVSRYFDILEVKSPMPWTMVLCKSRH